MSWDVMQGVVVTKECSKEDGGVDFSCEGRDNRDPSYAFGANIDEGQDNSDLNKGRDNSDPGEGRDNSDPAEGQGNRDPTCAFGAGAGEGRETSDPAQPVAA
jgi:hypothetical protein